MKNNYDHDPDYDPDGSEDFDGCMKMFGLLLIVGTVISFLVLVTLHSWR